MSTVTARRPVAIVPGKLFALSSPVALDGRVSWAPYIGGYQPSNCYLLTTGDGPVLVDTGLAVHRDVTVSQIAEVLAPEAQLSVFLTRAEEDCIGGLAAVLQAFDVTAVFTGGKHNPFDAFEDATAHASLAAKRQQLNRYAAPGGSQRVGELEVLSPAIRTLASFWAYHEGTRTLFSSDAFGHTTVARADARPVVDRVDVDDAAVDAVMAHLTAKFFWLRGARTGELVRAVRALFAEYPIDHIAPSHGCVLSGPAIAAGHLDLLCDALSRLEVG